MSNKIDQLLEKRDEILKKVDQSASGKLFKPVNDMQPVEKAIAAVLNGLFDPLMNDPVKFTQSMPEDELLQLGNEQPELYSLMELLTLAPYREILNNTNLRELKMQTESPSYKQPELRLSSLYQDREKPLEDFIEECAKHSLERRRAQGYTLAQGETEDTYNADFKGQLTTVLNHNETPRSYWKNGETQLLIICWTLAYTHTNEKNNYLSLERQTLPCTVSGATALHFPNDILTSDKIQREKAKKNEESAHKKGIASQAKLLLEEPLIALQSYDLPAENSKPLTGLKKQKVDAIRQAVEGIKEITKNLTGSNLPGRNDEGFNGIMGSIVRNLTGILGDLKEKSDLFATRRIHVANALIIVVGLLLGLIPGIAFIIVAARQKGTGIGIFGDRRKDTHSKVAVDRATNLLTAAKDTIATLKIKTPSGSASDQGINELMDKYFKPSARTTGGAEHKTSLADLARQHAVRAQ
jgi:hypothetical protein